MSIKPLLAIALALLGRPATAETPLSAIDWLSNSITAPVVIGQPEPPVSASALPAPVSVTPLDGPNPDAVGVLPPSVTGLPARLWGPGDPDQIAELIRSEPVDTLPAAQSLLTTILLAEATPPDAAHPDGQLLLARIDKLLDLGLVEEAGALLDRAGTDRPELFRRAFDVALLLGEENRACAAMRTRPDVAPTFPTRVFCLARGGDWTAAALTLGTARALGQITPDEEALLSRFLDPDLYEGEGPLRPPARPTPLIFRLHEAVGEPLPTATLPRAFAHADLRTTVGWKAQLEAAERLARTGAVDPNRVLGLFTERLPAASGGVWERVEALQRLDAAVASGNSASVEAALPAAWAEFEGAGLLPVLASLYAGRLPQLTEGTEAAAQAFRLALLSSDYEQAAASHTPRDREEEVLVAVARGLPPPRIEGESARALAGLADGAALPPSVAELLEQDRLGESLLLALEDLAAGRTGDPRRVAAALATFRAVGLESTARRAALEYLILASPA